MTDKLVKTTFSTALDSSRKYDTMLAEVRERLPMMIQGAEAFNKTSSQLKTVTLDITNVTPISSARHILASAQRTRQALEEASVGVKRKRIEREKALYELESMDPDSFDYRLKEVDVEEIENQLANIEASAQGAFRKLRFLMTQYEAIMARLGVDKITEEMYEEDERRYHVMTAFAQGMNATRSRGSIDEGNHIYLSQLGVPGNVAQIEINRYLEFERANTLYAGDELQKIPHPKHYFDFLNRMADMFASLPVTMAETRGLIPTDPNSMVPDDVQIHDD